MEYLTAKYKNHFILTFIVIVLSEDTLLFGTNANPIFMKLRFVSYIIILLFFYNSTWRHINKQVIAPILLIFVSFLLVMLLNKDFRNGYILQLLSILLAMKIANTIQFRDFATCFTNIIYFFSIVSIGLFVLVSVLPSAINLLPTINNIGDVQYGTILLSNIMKIDGTLRNSSIFREPGVFGIYLILGLLHLFFIESTINLKKIFVLIVALLTTYSTTAFFAMLLIILSYVFQGKNIKTKNYIFIIMILCAVFILPLISESIFAKLNENNAEYRSTFSRIASFSIPISIFIDHPLGVGLSNFVVLYPSYSYNLYGIEFKPEGEATNTLINSLAIYGLFYGTIILFAIWKLSFQYQRSTTGLLFVFFIFIFLYSSQDLRYSLLFNVLIIYGLIMHETLKTKQKLIK